MPARCRGRFAPTPSGDLHVGNLRTALVAWVAARQAGGDLVLRIEDLDPATARDDIAQRQIGDLADLGLQVDGPPLFQSTRRAAHAAAVEQLAGSGLLYPCFCTRKEIQAALSAPNAPIGAGYPGTCSHLSDDEIDRRLAAGRTPAWRVRTGGVTMRFVDRLLGPQEAPTDDFVVRRNDGLVAYHVAVVVDDAAQQVTQVVRADDLLDSTPRQRWLQQVLGLPEPEYAHVPLVLGSDGARLAKRHGAVTLADLAADGWTPRAVLALLGASLGWCRPDDSRSVDALLAAFVAEFRFEDLPRQPWVLATSWP